MTALKQVTILGENAEDEEDWNYIRWSENEEERGEGVTDSETQTEAEAVTVAAAAVGVDKATQTSSPVIMHIDLSRTPSRLKHAVEAVDGAAPLFQFDRQAPARISTSPTLRRIRSTRRPIPDFRDSVRMASTREEPGGAEGQDAPLSPLFPSPLTRQQSPLAISAPPGGGVSQHGPPGSGSGSSSDSSVPQDNPSPRSRRSKTFDNGRPSSAIRPSSLILSDCKDFDFADSKDQEKECDHSRLQERRRSSVVVSLPGLDVSPGDLFVSNGAADILNSSNYSDTKKSKWPFSRRSTTKGKSATRGAADVEKLLCQEPVPDWAESAFHKYKDCSLGEFLRERSLQGGHDAGPQDYKRREAVWEIFTSECVYFLDQLMVLKEVFLSTLTSLQMRECLSDVDAWRLFANLNELCLVSFDFLGSLLRVITESWSPGPKRGPTLLELLTKAFQGSICQSLQKYCLNYSSSLLYIDSLRTRPDFTCYLKWCEKHQACRRLRVQDLLVAPLQRLTRYPLLLRNVKKRSSEEEEESALQRVLEQVENSICDLEGKVKWLDNYQKVKQLRDSLVWLPVWERDKRAFIPENLKHLLKAVTLENLITHRSLHYEGRLVLTENAKLHDVYLFLFDEFLLITKIKRTKKKSTASEQGALLPAQNAELDQLLKEGCTFTVLDQPVSLDRLQLRNVDQLNASASGLPHSFIIMHQNRYQQVIGVFILQAPSEAVKREWISKLEGAVTALLKMDSQQPRLKSASLWVESSQI